MIWRKFCSVCAVLCVVACERAQAQTEVDWTSTGDTTFSTSANWDNNMDDGAVPGSGSLVFFTNGNGTVNLLTLDTSASMAGIVSQGTGTAGGNLSIVGPGTLFLGSNGITLSGGTSETGAMDIDADVVLCSDQTWGLNDSNIWVNGAISGSSELMITSNGAGSVVLNSGASTYSGGTWVTGAGTYLSLGASSTMDGSEVISGPAGTGTISLDNGTFLTTPSGLGTISVGNSIAIGSAVTFSPDPASPLTLSGTISDIEEAGSLIIAGPVTLTGDNTYSGGTTINCMTTLQLGDGGTTGSIIGDVVDNGTLVIDRSNCYTFSGNISGNGGVTIQQGMLTLGGSNTYYGTTSLAPNTSLSDATSYAFSPNSDVFLGMGATLNVYYNEAIQNLSDASCGSTINLGEETNLTVYSTGNSTYYGYISGSGSLTVEGNGGTTLTLLGDSDYSGGTTIGCMTTLQLGDGGTSGSITGNVVDHGTLSFDRSDCITFSGVICGNGGVTLQQGMVTLGGNNSYYGQTNLGAHTTLSDSTSYAYSPNSDVFLGMGATLNVYYNEAIQNLNDATCGSTVNLGSEAGLSVFNTGSNTYYGYITGSGSLTVNGNSSTSLTLLGSNDYSGGTTIGCMTTLQLGDGGTSGSITGSVVDNGTLAFDRSNCLTFCGPICGVGSLNVEDGMVTLVGDSTYSGGTNIACMTTLQLGNGGTTGSITGNVVDNGTLSFDRSDCITFSGIICGNGGVTLQQGMVTLGGNNTYSGQTNLNPNTVLSDSTPYAYSPNSDVYLGMGATLNVNYSEAIQNLNDATCGSTVNLAVETDLTVYNTGCNTYYGYITGPGGLVVNGNGGTKLTLVGDSDYSGGTTIGCMTTLQLGNGGTTGSIAGDVYDSGTLAFDRSNCITFSGNISGNGGVNVEQGMVVLNGSNSYSGGTTISNASVTVGNDWGLGSAWVDAISSVLNLGSASPFVNSLMLTDSTANFTSDGGSPTLFNLSMQNSTLNFAPNSIPAIEGLVSDGPGSTNAINLGAGSTLFFYLGSDPAFYGTVNGAGALDVEGFRQELDLFGANTYTGGTTIGANMLVVAGNNSAFGTAPVSMGNAAALGIGPGVTVTNTVNTGSNAFAMGGFGTFDPAVPQSISFQGGSVLAGGGGRVGNAFGSTSTPVVGTFSFGSGASVVLGPGGFLQFSIMNAAGTPGVDFSTINATGSVDITATPGSPFEIQVIGVDSTNLITGTANSFNSSQSYSWTLLSAGTLTMSGGFNPAAFVVDAGNLSNVSGSSGFYVTDPGNSLVLNFTPVPEPSTWVLLAGGALALGIAGWRRHRAPEKRAS